MKKPLISILICNYNYAAYIDEAITSAIEQDYPNIEIVVVDDGSSDNSTEVIKRLIKQNPAAAIRLKAKKTNQGICYARNDALDLARGDYTLFLDSDDTIPKDYVSTLYDLAVVQNADVVYCDMKIFGDEETITDFPQYEQGELLLHNYVHISSLVKTSSIKGQRFDTKLNRKTLEDYDFWVGLSLMGLKFVKSEKVLLNYRVQNQSRNDNTADYVTRVSTSLDVWGYIVTKYRDKFPRSIPEDIVFEKLKYQIKDISDELEKLNGVVQDELLPELGKREEHIRFLDGQISVLQKKANSIDYRIGRAITRPVRAIKSSINNIKNDSKRDHSA